MRIGEGFFVSFSSLLLPKRIIKGKGKEKLMQLDTINYNIKKVKFPDGQIQITLKPKKCNCYGCKKQIEWKGANSINWIDDDGYKREGRFCRDCHNEIKKMGIIK